MRNPLRAAKSNRAASTKVVPFPRPDTIFEKRLRLFSDLHAHMSSLKDIERGQRRCLLDDAVRAVDEGQAEVVGVRVNRGGSVSIRLKPFPKVATKTTKD